MKREVQDTHGFFQFIAPGCGGSDNDGSDSEDGIFGTTRQRKKEFDIAAINYVPKQNYDRWFDTSDSCDFDEQFAKSGATLTELKFSIERAFSGQEYARALELSQRYINTFRRARGGRLPKLASMREVIEIGCLASLKLENFKGALGFVNLHTELSTNDPAIYLFRGNAYYHCRNYAKYTTYDTIRRNDALVWQNLAVCVRNVYEGSECGVQLALDCLKKAEAIIEYAHWPDNPIAAKRLEKYKNDIDGLARCIIGGTDATVDWRHAVTASPAANATYRQRLVQDYPGEDTTSISKICKALYDVDSRGPGLETGDSIEKSVAEL
ncbi:hypothetical protein EV182_000893 [Spiromyces aspiralis]|uniref:Uncharacterized protein n=1 Tax=Spiromyces aspiralis TaxID=68401 RepID=A0ACC1HJW8_9FUNG|nr:hypothetical protein EV182_000893 [Spiromyces aspiralis]